jgi:hypothetical protein
VGCGGVYLIYKRGKTERPITDIAIIFRDGEKQRLGEAAPPEFECITKTLVSGTSADLNSGVGREIYLCVKRVCLAFAPILNLIHFFPFDTLFPSPSPSPFSFLLFLGRSASNHQVGNCIC